MGVDEKEELMECKVQHNAAQGYKISGLILRGSFRLTGSRVPKPDGVKKKSPMGLGRKKEIHHKKIDLHTWFQGISLSKLVYLLL